MNTPIDDVRKAARTLLWERRRRPLPRAEDPFLTRCWDDLEKALSALEPPAPEPTYAPASDAESLRRLQRGPSRLTLSPDQFAKLDRMRESDELDALGMTLLRTFLFGALPSFLAQLPRELGTETEPLSPKQEDMVREQARGAYFPLGSHDPEAMAEKAREGWEFVRRLLATLDQVRGSSETPAPEAPLEPFSQEDEQNLRTALRNNDVRDLLPFPSLWMATEAARSGWRAARRLLLTLDRDRERLGLHAVVRLDLGEEDRQLVLLALAHLSLERPGFDDALHEVARRIDNEKDGRATLYDEFRRSAGGTT